MTSLDSQAMQNVPKHVAVIMDGNGRWAQQRGKKRTFGHKAGVESVRRAVKFSLQNGIQALTLFAFSSENWQRPEQEVSVLMELFLMVLGSEVKKLHKNGVRLNIVGDTSRFDDKIRRKIADAEKLTANNTALVLNIAANYGGRWDITQAAQTLAAQVAEGKLAATDITEQMMAEQMCLADLPELDLLIRTGGDHRVSNFLLWQVGYAELYFTDILWPDFDQQAFTVAIDSFANRQRRYGKTGEQVTTQPEQANEC